ncbi:MAG: hypothetical protein HEQ35_31110 [Gloeotrichia echinulata IR180]
MTQPEIRQLGIDTLTLALGPGGMGLFMHQFEMGNGDYTQDRDQILGNSTVTNIVERIKQRRTQLESSEVLPKVTDMKMIDVTKLTQAEIRRLGIEALTKALGPAGMARFIQQFEIGSGDYTRDRDEILGNPSIEEIVAQIKQMRRQQQDQGEK